MSFGVFESRVAIHRVSSKAKLVVDNWNDGRRGAVDGDFGSSGVEGGGDGV